MSKHFEQEFKQKIVRLHLEDGRTIRSIAEEYGVSKASISNWVYQYLTGYTSFVKNAN